MSEQTTEPAAGTGGGDMKTWTVVIYVLYLASFFTGITAIVGVIMAYVKKGQGGALWDSHLIFAIRTFWIGLIVGLIGVVLTFVFVGVLVLFALGVWWLVRVIVGLIKAASDEPIPAPQSWLVGL